MSDALAIQPRSPAAHCRRHATLLSVRRASRAPLTVAALAVCAGLVGGGIFLAMKKKNEAAAGGQGQGDVALSKI